MGNSDSIDPDLGQESPSSPEPTSKEKRRARIREAKAKAAANGQTPGPAPEVPSQGPTPLVEGWRAYGLAWLSGFLYFIAFPGIDIWPLAAVALVPLIVALRGQTVKRAAGLGWLSGLTMTVCGFYWLMGMLQTFSGFPLPLCALFMVLLCAYQGGRIALCGWLYGRAERRGWPSGPVFAAAFIASELLYPLLFPWTYAATVHQVPVLLQLAELGGTSLVVLVLVAANMALALPLIYWLEGRNTEPGDPSPARRVARAEMQRKVARLAAVVVGALIYGMIRIPQVDAQVAQAEKATVGVVQANMSLHGKTRHPEEGLERHLRLTQQLASKGRLDLAVWSETSVTRPKWEDQAVAALRREVTSRVGVPLVFGAVLARPVDDAREATLFNSALLSDATGDLCDEQAPAPKTPGAPCEPRRYDKRYLLAFGEYLPLGETFPILYQWSPNSGQFTPGTRYLPLQLANKQIAVFICYEDILPGYVNQIVGNGNPNLLVNMTNDAWFGDTTEPWIHFALAKLRAVEHRRFLVRSTNSGVSGFVDPVGRTISHGSTFQEEAFTAEVAWLSSKTAYDVLGNLPWWLTTAVMVAGAFVNRRRPKAEKRTPVDAKPTDGPPLSPPDRDK